MAKKVSLEGKEIASVVKIGKAEIIHFTDGTFIIVEMLSDNIAAEDAGFEAGEDAEDDEEDEDAEEEEDEDDSDEDEEEEDEDEEEEDEDDEDGLSIEDMKEALLDEKIVSKKKLAKMDDEDIEALYDENFDEEDEDEEEEEEEDEDDEDTELSKDDLKAADFDDLDDIIDEHDLDIDIEDYDEKKVEKLRKAVAKALKIKL